MGPKDLSYVAIYCNISDFKKKNLLVYMGVWSHVFGDPQAITSFFLGCNLIVFPVI